MKQNKRKFTMKKKKEDRISKHKTRIEKNDNKHLN